MRRRLVMMVLAGAAAVWCTAPLPVTAEPAARAVAWAGTWGTAIEVPGLASLNQGGQAEVRSVSCGAAGNCAAAGGYLDGSFRYQVFVASETNGTWGNAIKVPGTGILNAGGNAAIFSPSCATAGNCAAGGFYKDGSGHTQAFVVSEGNGTWGKAIEVPGSAALNAGGDASVDSVSCASVGNCAAGGSYTDGTGQAQAFVVSETNGTFPQGDRGPRLGHPERRSVWQRHHGVVRHGRQLRRRPDLHGRHRATAGVRGQSDERHLGQRDGDTRLGHPERGRECQRQLGVVRLGG